MIATNAQAIRLWEINRCESNSEACQVIAPSSFDIKSSMEKDQMYLLTVADQPS